jgi:hypothetical protein
MLSRNHRCRAGLSREPEEGGSPWLSSNHRCRSSSSQECSIFEFEMVSRNHRCRVGRLAISSRSIIWTVRAFLIKKFLFAAIVMAWLFEKFSQILDDQVSEMIQQMCKTVAEMGEAGRMHFGKSTRVSRSGSRSTGHCVLKI